MNKYLDFRTLVIATLSFLLILMWFKKGEQSTNKIIKVNGKSYEVIKEVHDTIITPGKIVHVYKKGETIHDTLIKTVYKEKIDTNIVIKDYFYTRVYNDTISLGENNFAYISDTITKNKLLSRNFNYKIDEKVINNILYLKEPEKTQFYWGLEGNVSPDLTFQSFGGSIMMKTKDKKIIKLNIGVLNKNGVTPYYGVGFYKKIGK